MEFKQAHHEIYYPIICRSYSWVRCFKIFSSNELPPAFTTAMQTQANPFRTGKDSADIVWARAKEFLNQRKGLIVGDDLQVTDSSYYIPYYNSHKKGDCVFIGRKMLGDSVIFYVQCWYSKEPNEKLAKEIALYMQRNINKYRL